MPFFEKKVQIILRRIKNEGGERKAIVFYQNIAAFVLKVDLKKPDFENCFNVSLFVSTEPAASELIAEISKFHHSQKKANRFQISAYSGIDRGDEMIVPAKLKIKSSRTNFKKWFYQKALNEIDFLFENRPRQNRDWNFLENSKDWNLASKWKVGWPKKLASAERNRRRRILKYWPELRKQISQRKP